MGVPLRPGTRTTQVAPGDRVWVEHVTTEPGYLKAVATHASWSGNQGGGTDFRWYLKVEAVQLGNDCRQLDVPLLSFAAPHGRLVGDRYVGKGTKIGILVRNPTNVPVYISIEPMLSACEVPCGDLFGRFGLVW